MTTPEGKIKQKISHVLSKHKAYYFMPVPTGFQATSIDYFACLKGRFIAIEAKAPGKHLTSRQDYVFELIRAAGGLTFEISSPEEIEALDKVLGELL